MFYGGTLAGYERAALYCTRALQNGSVVHTAEQTQEAVRGQWINCLDVFVHSARPPASFHPCASSFALLRKSPLHFCSPEVQQALRYDLLSHHGNISDGSWRQNV